METKNITSYKEYIEHCKTHDTGVDVSKFTFDVNGKDLGITTPDNYDELISKLHEKVVFRINSKQYTEDTLLLAIQNMINVEEVKQLGEHFSKELSEKLYGTEVFIDHVHTYKNKITNDSDKSSWLWHYDDVAPGHIKIMFYLTPTTKDTGAFLVLKSADGYKLMDSSKISPTKSTTQTFPQSRIPKNHIDKLKSEGYYEHHVEGEAGTFMVFNHNVIHKATKPTKTPERICMIFIFRPYHKKLDKHIDIHQTHQWGYKGSAKLYNYETNLG